MGMARLIGLILAGLISVAVPPAALAQPPAAPDESVTVAGTRAREVAQGFVQSNTLPTHFAGKIARWETPVCPYAVGIKPEAAAFIVARVRDIAVQAGARAGDGKNCAWNIEIIFTRTPQALLNDMRRNQPELLGYAVDSAEKDRLAQFIRPIQGWYLTATRDRNGVTAVDSPHTVHGAGVNIILPCEMMGQVPPTAWCTYHNPYAQKVNVEGSMLGDRTHSLLDHVVIVADPGKLTDYELGAVSDYIAMLALAQLPASDGCQPLPSILDLLKQGCAKVEGLTENDRAYLRGLYRMPADLDVSLQRDAIVNEMIKGEP